MFNGSMAAFQGVTRRVPTFPVAPPTASAARGGELQGWSTHEVRKTRDKLQVELSQRGSLDMSLAEQVVDLWMHKNAEIQRRQFENLYEFARKVIVDKKS